MSIPMEMDEETETLWDHVPRGHVRCRKPQCDKAARTPLLCLAGGPVRPRLHHRPSHVSLGLECLATNTHIRSAQEMQVSQGMRDGLPGFAER